YIPSNQFHLLTLQRVYQNACTHLIIPQVLASEKFLAFCAAGKWVVTPNYVLDSVRNSSWLPEGPYEVAVPTDPMSAFYPVRQWREKVTSGAITGAFQGWRVLLMVQDSSRLVMFKRLTVTYDDCILMPPKYVLLNYNIWWDA
uniref:BRCT domain-containing protein n=1 Tax=Hippocampus comes TaxID=109280 RepID=A0A3Q2Z6N0_HIPCM